MGLKYMYIYVYVHIHIYIFLKKTVMESHTSVQSSSFQPLMKNPILRN